MDERREIQQLVDAARQGDPDAFGRLFDRFYPSIYRYSYARLGSVTDAEDAAAETFVSALVAIPRFLWRGAPFEAWLFRIAASKVVDARRRQGRQREDVLTDRSDAESSDPDPAQHLLEVERRRHLFDAVDRLPRAQRDVVLLRFVARRSVAEVAAQMRRSPGAIQQLQFRALARLRRLLEG